MLKKFTFAMLALLLAFANFIGIETAHTTTIQTERTSVIPQTDFATFETALFAAMPTEQNYMLSPFSLRMALGINDLDAFNQTART